MAGLIVYIYTQLNTPWLEHARARLSGSDLRVPAYDLRNILLTQEKSRLNLLFILKI